ncbi:hypothetical protein [Cytobacillus sp. IB215665]|uniref:YncE family protein n=1 Tax=Cytobacillus sp. IB215665 TaxID=3097357 RepID=UPI002A10066C|nr:hypothetical protein [Cytobacillus sp. IB215665]MDX8366804.1 hypothetical protein [Cytobacillus sp. IB215665]
MLLMSKTHSLIATVSVGNRPYCIAITQEGRFAYASNNGSSTISVVETTTHSVIATIQLVYKNL